jgi:hypothetical protein
VVPGSALRLLWCRAVGLVALGGFAPGVMTLGVIAVAGLETTLGLPAGVAGACGGNVGRCGGIGGLVAVVLRLRVELLRF